MKRNIRLSTGPLPTRLSAYDVCCAFVTKPNRSRKKTQGAEKEERPQSQVRREGAPRFFRLFSLFFGLRLIASSVSVAAASSPPNPIPVPAGPEQVTIASTRLKEDRPVLVYLPESYRHTSDRYPVLIVVDGDGPGAKRAMAVVNLLSDLTRGEIPELLVITIPNTNRTRDLRPAAPPGMKAAASAGAPAAPEANARVFLEFIEFELLPEIDRRYRTHPVRFLHGSSSGGIFGVFAFVERPELFRGIVASSPSFWIDDKVWIPRFERSLSTRPATPQWLYVSAGEFDHPTISEPIPKVEAILRAGAPASLSWQVEVLKGCDHQSAEPAALTQGLRHLFAKFDAPHAKVAAMTIDDLRRHYASVSVRYGWPARPPMWAWNRLLLQKDIAGHSPAEVLAAAEALIADYPWHPYGYEISTWFAGIGAKDRALASAEKAVSVARQSGYWTRDLDTTVAKLRKESGK